MFTVYCQRHGARVLLSARCIVGLTRRTDGVEVRWRCTCDEEGTTLMGADGAGERIPA